MKLCSDWTLDGEMLPECATATITACMSLAYALAVAIICCSRQFPPGMDAAPPPARKPQRWLRPRAIVGPGDFPPKPRSRGHHWRGAGYPRATHVLAMVCSGARRCAGGYTRGRDRSSSYHLLVHAGSMGGFRGCGMLCVLANYDGAHLAPDDHGAASGLRSEDLLDVGPSLQCVPMLHGGPSIHQRRGRRRPHARIQSRVQRRACERVPARRFHRHVLHLGEAGAA